MNARPGNTTTRIAFLLALATGCSFTMQEAPDPPYRTMPDCETSRAKPVIDLLGAGTALSLALTFALVAAVEDSLDETGSGDGDAGTVALVSLGAGAVFTVASISGFRKGTRCRSAQAEFTTMMYYNAQRPAYPYQAPTQAPTQAPPPATTTTTTTTTTTPAKTTPPPPPPKSTVPVGAERGLCRSDGTCDPGLTCASGHCVFLPR
jgi:hypothetical protein